MNVVITEKNKPREIRMNVDATPLNGGIRRTKFHVRTPQEVRHDLVGAAVFTEMDMSNEYGVPPAAYNREEQQ